MPGPFVILGVPLGHADCTNLCANFGKVEPDPALLVDPVLD